MATQNQIKFIAATGEEIELAESNKFEIRQTLGVDPYVFYAPIHSSLEATVATMIASAKAANRPWVTGKFEITTSDDTATGSRVVEWGGWVIIETVPDPELEDIVQVGFADLRFGLTYGKIDAKFNMYFDRGDPTEADDDSLNAGSNWTIAEYLSELIDLFDAKISPLFPIFTWGGAKNMTDATILDVDLPKNLGNTITFMGGWAAASWAEMVEPVMKALGVTFLQGMNGSLYVTDLVSERADVASLYTVSMEQSYYRSMDNSARLPKEVDVVFEVRKEVAFETLPVTTSGSEQLYLENVLRQPSDVGTNAPSYEWKSLEDGWWNNSSTGISYIPAKGAQAAEYYISQNYFKEMIIPYGYDFDGLLLAGGEVVDYMNSEIEASWRRAFRVHASGDGHQWVNVRLGRLEPDGGNKAAGNVFADYTYIRRRGRIFGVPQPGRHVLAQARWTESFDFNSWPNQPAPFVAYWSDPSQMIIQLGNAKTNAVMIKDVIVGKMDEHLGYGEFVKLVQNMVEGDHKITLVGEELFRTKPRGTLSDTYKLRIIGNASPVKLAKRTYTVTKTAYGTSGIVPKQVLKAYGITANYKFSDAQMALSKLSDVDASELMNSTELDTIAERVKNELIRSYEQNNIGAIKVGGTSPLSGTPVEAGGECNEMWIEVGGEPGMESMVTTNYSVKPGLIEINVSRRELDGPKVKVAI